MQLISHVDWSAASDDVTCDVTASPERQRYVTDADRFTTVEGRRTCYSLTITNRMLRHCDVIALAAIARARSHGRQFTDSVAVYYWCHVVLFSTWSLIKCLPVPRRPLSVCLQCRLQTTFALPAEIFSSCLAIVSAVMVGQRAFSVAGPAIWNWLSDSLRAESHQLRLLQSFTEDVFIFSLLVYIAH